MSGIYVTDTNALISYFHDVFGVNRDLSARTRRLVAEAFHAYPTDVKLSIPAVVFLEVFEKWFVSEEFAARFHYEVFAPIHESPNIEVKPIDQEVLENLARIEDDLRDEDMHDKIILASAMMLNCPLITTDEVIIKYVNTNPVIPFILN
jgi:predicted nucleic acid-binding protein